MLNTLIWEAHFVVFAGRDTRQGRPPCHKNWNGGKQGEEDERLQPTADFVFQVVGNEKTASNNEVVVERVAARAFSRERSIGDSGILQLKHHEYNCIGILPVLHEGQLEEC